MDFGTQVLIVFIMMGIGLRQLGKVVSAKPVIGDAAAKGVANIISRILK